jgi:hypothetical protein
MRAAVDEREKLPAYIEDRDRAALYRDELAGPRRQLLERGYHVLCHLLHPVQIQGISEEKLAALLVGGAGWEAAGGIVEIPMGIVG